MARSNPTTPDAPEDEVCLGEDACRCNSRGLN